MDWSRGWVEPEEKAGRLLAEVLTAGWKLAELHSWVLSRGDALRR